jgi:hypothetical protein
LKLTVSGQTNAVSLGSVRVAGVARVMTPPPMDYALAQPLNLGNQIEFLGYDLEKEKWGAGEPIRVTLYWRALAPMTTDYKVFVHLLDQNGGIVAQSDVGPADWTRPTTGWVAGEIVADSHTLPPTPARVPGTYDIAVGMYSPETMTRLEMRKAGERLPDDRAILGQVTVE